MGSVLKPYTGISVADTKKDIGSIGGIIVMEAFIKYVDNHSFQMRNRKLTKLSDPMESHLKLQLL